MYHCTINSMTETNAKYQKNSQAIFKNYFLFAKQNNCHGRKEMHKYGILGVLLERLDKPTKSWVAQNKRSWHLTPWHLMAYKIQFDPGFNFSQSYSTQYSSSVDLARMNCVTPVHCEHPVRPDVSAIESSHQFLPSVPELLLCLSIEPFLYKPVTQKIWESAHAQTKQK